MISVADPNQGAASEPKILYEDADLLIVDKPAGWLTVPTPKKESKTLLSWASAHVRASGGKKAYAAHRIDRETSGAVALACSPKALENLENQFREHSPGRTYLALVQGKIAPPEGRLVHRLLSDPRRQGAQAVTKNPRLGVEAVTEYKTAESFGGATLLEIRPRTGRTNQIRVQMAHVGHPLVGDRKYSAAGKFALQARRTLLHAASLSLRHPASGRPVSVEAPLPRDFEEALGRLRAGR